VAKVFKDLLENVCQNNDIAPWKALLAFPYTVLRLPQSRKRHKLHQVVRKNLNDFHNGVGLEEVLSHVLRRYHLPKNRTRSKNPELLKAKLASSKLCEGDVRGAVRILNSRDEILQMDGTVDASLRERHPPAPDDLQDCPNFNSADLRQKLSISKEDVIRAIRSFPRASSASFDGLRPRHLRDMVAVNIHELPDAILSFCEKVMFGELPSHILPLFYGATLTALRKPSGGVRPIACGMTLRRLSAKLLLARSSNALANKLQPKQLGYGVPGSCEAIVHAARAYVEHNHDSVRLLVKLDFQNAFNTLRRDWILRQVENHAPDLLPMSCQAYGAPSLLIGDGIRLTSASGVQQGDPAGPALFCIALKELTDSLQSEMTAWYLDDGVIAGDPSTVIADIWKVIHYGPKSGLSLNIKKCELFAFGGSAKDREEAINQANVLLPQAQILGSESLMLLGAPLLPQAVNEVFKSKVSELRLLCKRLPLMSTHESLCLLKFALFAPKVNYLLRCTPAYKRPDLLHQIDDVLRNSLEEILNITMDDRTFNKITLPLEGGGLGVRSAEDLSLPCFAASLTSSLDLIKSIIPEAVFRVSCAEADGLKETFANKFGGDISKLCFYQQCDLDKALWEEKFERLLSTAENEAERARMRASRSPLASKWLQAFPSTRVGTLLDNNSFRVCVGLRYGTRLCHPHKCNYCDALIDQTAAHSLSCRRSQGRQVRHQMINKELQQTLRKANIPSVLEPPGLGDEDGKRPDGMTLVPWARGMPLVWDATVWCTLAPSYVSVTSREPGAAANRAEAQKIHKYRTLQQHFLFFPVAIETLGCTGEKTTEFLEELSAQLVRATGDQREKEFFLQRLSLCVQRGNAAAIMAELLPREDE